MIHPDATVRTVSPEIGNGVFATKFIPKGTIIVVRDAFDIVLKPEEFRQLPDLQQCAMETYMYRDRYGNMVLSWDHARYMNHNCFSNSLMTAYNLELTVRDIEPGEEITTDYGLLNIIEPYQIFCKCHGCREVLNLDDIDRFADTWDEQIKDALALVRTVPQPLVPLIDALDLASLDAMLDGLAPYQSVKNLKYDEPGVDI